MVAKKAKNSKFEYKPNIYEENNQFLETDYWDRVSNKEATELELHDFDLHPLSSELYNQHLPQFIHLKKLVLVQCNLQNFQPKGLGKLEELILTGNQISNFSQVEFSRLP